MKNQLKLSALFLSISVLTALGCGAPVQPSGKASSRALALEGRVVPLGGVPVCGNNVIEAANGETCDDGNTLDGDGCDKDCLLECVTTTGTASAQYNRGVSAPTNALGAFDGTVATLGSGDFLVLQVPDVLELGTFEMTLTGNVSGDAEICYSSDNATFDNCQNYTPAVANVLETITLNIAPQTRYIRVENNAGAVRVDGVEYANEYCFDCGNGIIDPETNCDDGNTNNGDGCNQHCQLEAGCVWQAGSGVAFTERRVASPTNALNTNDALLASLTIRDELVVELADTLPADIELALVYETNALTDTATISFSTDGVVFTTPVDMPAGTLLGNQHTALSTPTIPVRYVRIRGTGGSYRIDSVNYRGNAFCSVCGDGIIDGEQCDDGNTTDGDGCDSLCNLEVGCSLSTGAVVAQYAQGVGTETQIVGSFDELSSVLNSTDQQVVDLGVVIDAGQSIGIRTAAGALGETVDVYFSADGIDYSALPLSFEAGLFNSSTNYGFLPLVLPEETRFLKFNSTSDLVRLDSVEYINAMTCQSCGNGLRENTEACDDGNTLGGDGCDENCAIEAGCALVGPAAIAQTNVGVTTPANALALPDGERALITTGEHMLFDFGEVFSAGTVIHIETSGETAGTSFFSLSCSEDAIHYSPLSSHAASSPVNAYEDIEVTCPIDARYVRVHREVTRLFVDAVTVEENVQCDACGNGHIETGELCDDGNLIPGDGCDATCQLEGDCTLLSNFGTSVTHVGVGSPNSSLGAPDGALAVVFGANDVLNVTLDQPVLAGTTIVVAMTVANGATASVTFSDGEGCDEPSDEVLLTGSLDGSTNSVEYFNLVAPIDTAMITIAAEGVARVDMVGAADQIRCGVCGDGITDPGETCDDGDTDNDDGCDENCVVEASASCDTCNASFCTLALTYASIAGVFDIEGRATFVTDAEFGTRSFRVYSDDERGERSLLKSYDVFQSHPFGHRYDIEDADLSRQYWVEEEDFHGRVMASGPYSLLPPKVRTTETSTPETQPNEVPVIAGALGFGASGAQAFRFEAPGVGIFELSIAELSSAFAMDESQVREHLREHSFGLTKMGQEVRWVESSQGLAFAQAQRRDARFWPTYQLTLLPQGSPAAKVIDEAPGDLPAAVPLEKVVFERQVFPPLLSSPDVESGADLFYSSTLATVSAEYRRVSLGDDTRPIVGGLRCWFWGAQGGHLADYTYGAMLAGANGAALVARQGDGMHEVFFKLDGASLSDIEIELGSSNEAEMVSYLDRCEAWVHSSTATATTQRVQDAGFAEASGLAVLFREGECFEFKKGELLPEDRLFSNAPKAVKGLRPLLAEQEISANYLVVGPQSFANTLEPLVQKRSEEGYRTQFIALESIFDHGAFSHRDPRAVENFIDALPGDTTVVLVGAGHLDYLGDIDAAPNHIPPQHTLGANGLRPAMPKHARVGVLPASTLEEAQGMVEGLVGYEASAHYSKSRVLMVDEDAGQTVDFESQVVALYSALNSLGPTELFLYRETQEPTREAQTLLALQEKSWVNYVGHSGLVGWSQQPWIDAAALTPNTRLPLMTGWTCLWNHFAFPGVDSFGEIALRKQSALAVYAPLSVVPHDDNQAMSLMFLEAAKGAHTLGDILDALPQKERSLFVLLGDPAMPLPMEHQPGDFVPSVEHEIQRPRGAPGQAPDDGHDVVASGCASQSAVAWPLWLAGGFLFLCARRRRRIG